jgi:hypothetical protein
VKKKKSWDFKLKRECSMSGRSSIGYCKKTPDAQDHLGSPGYRPSYWYIRFDGDKILNIQVGNIPLMPNSLDPRFLAGIDLFNRGDYFEAHEVWEELWLDCPSAERRFYQALIQAAVAIYHFGRGNNTGAARLARSGKRYMDAYRPSHSGLDVDGFWRQVEAYIAPALMEGASQALGERPAIILAPAPAGLP